MGSVFDTGARAPVSREQLLDAMSEAQVVYLGEKHDNPHHHAWQQHVVESLVERGRRPAIALEVFSVEQTPVLMGYVQAPAGARGLEDAVRRGLGWAGTERDESWEAYGPLVSLARAHGLAIAGIDLPKSLRLRVARVGVEGLSTVERALLSPSGFRDDAYARLVAQWLRDAHCGGGSDAYIGRLYESWVARNDTMALTIHRIVQDIDPEPVVVVLGAGHVRHDMGVPERLQALRPDVRQVNVSFVEVRDGVSEAGRYAGEAEVDGRAFGPRHRYLWFTVHTGAVDVGCGSGAGKPAS